MKSRHFVLLWPVLLFWSLNGCAHQTTLTRADIRLYGGTGGGTQPAQSDSLVCVSYNIAFSVELEKALIDLAADPRLRNPDILLLQEMDAEGATLMADRLGMNHYYYPSFISPHHGRLFGNAVLSPWPLTNPRWIVLPHANPMNDNQRVALAVDVNLGTRIVRAVSVHLSTVVVDQKGRLEQAAVVRDSLVSAIGPTIIGGDFNTGTNWEEVLFRREMRKTGFKEARLPVEKTARGGPLDLLGHKLKLDHFYYRDLHFVAGGTYAEGTASDHFPIWSVFRWQ